MHDLLNQNGLFAWDLAQRMFLQTTILVLGLLLIDLLIGRHLRSALRYGLWLLVVVKLLLPPSLLLPTGAGFWVGQLLSKPAQETSTPHTFVVEEVEPTLVADREPTSTSHSTVPDAGLTIYAKLLLIWGAGCLLLAGALILRNRQVKQLVRESVRASDELTDTLHQAVKALQLRRTPELRISNAHHSPVVCGCFRPVILLPRDLAESLTLDKVYTVLLHELTHIRRWDLWMNFAQAAVQVVWWWNPIVWMVNSHIRSLREQAVDEAVMSEISDPTVYPSTLLDVARHCAGRPMLALSLLGIFESRRSLRFRLTRLLTAPLPRQTHLGWSGWTTLVVAALVALPMAFPRPVVASPNDEQRGAEFVDLAAEQLGHEQVPPETEDTQLYTRRFTVNTDRFLQAVDDILGKWGPDEATEEDLSKSIQIRVREVFRQAGVDTVTPPSDASPEELSKLVLIYFDHIKGMLYVRSTQDQLLRSESVVKKLNRSHAQVVIETKIIEIAATEIGALGLEWLLGSTPTLPGDRFAGGAPNGGGATAPPSSSAKGILTEEQYRTLLESMETRSGVKLLSAPRVTTLSGRQARVTLSKADPVAGAESNLNPISFGTSVDLFPEFWDAQESVEMTVLVNYSDYVENESNGSGPPKVLKSFPLNAHAIMLDGQTLVLSGEILEYPLSAGSNPAPDHPDAQRTGRLLVVFVTPTIIDNAGRRLFPKGNQSQPD
jgi:beta-lactamase regulating signal transducer with metallopeptidase domain